jgi:hypothetical protein
MSLKKMGKIRRKIILQNIKSGLEVFGLRFEQDTPRKQVRNVTKEMQLDRFTSILIRYKETKRAALFWIITQ